MVVEDTALILYFPCFKALKVCLGLQQYAWEEVVGNMKQITISHVSPVAIVSEQFIILKTFVKMFINDRSRTSSWIFKAHARTL